MTKYSFVPSISYTIAAAAPTATFSVLPYNQPTDEFGMIILSAGNSIKPMYGDP